MRLVDAEVVERNICLSCPNEHTCSESKQRGVTPIACIYMIAIDDAPTIEAEPVRHGRWVNDIFCSECSRFPVDVSCHISNQDLTKYFSRCPHCGARMDGGEDCGTAD